MEKIISLLLIPLITLRACSYAPPPIKEPFPVKSVTTPTCDELTYPVSKERLEECGYKPIIISMYNVGDISQTDESPCIGASGDNLCKLLDKINVCAFNQLPLKSKVKILIRTTEFDYNWFGDCYILDRTAQYHSDRLDWALPNFQQQKAFNFGLGNGYYKIIN